MALQRGMSPSNHTDIQYHCSDSNSTEEEKAYVPIPPPSRRGNGHFQRAN